MSGKFIVTDPNVQTLSYHTESLEKVRTALNGITEGKGFVEENRNLIIEGILQTVDSLIQYGQYRGFTSTFTLKLEMKPNLFRAVLCDNGNDVDLEEEITDTRLRREKNYSINTGLLRQVMDQISYNYKRGSQSELELVNYLP
tara:strand:- start:534 stop:962 length:429 start_codon:yes stop_codon:yes gene_type:complete